MARREQHISRSSILYGSTEEETWFDLDQFYIDHMREIGDKITQLDDEIWGKIVLMERNKRVAKAYLRTTTLIVDGTRNGFDGKTLGFNSFDNPFRDSHVEELKAKIGEGLALRMDYQGNILALARGTAPVFIQGWKNKGWHCMADRLIKCKGRLEPATPHVTEKERAVKVFDMKIFKCALERSLSQSCPNPTELLYKTCVRVALVKEGSDPIKTPCWFLLINLVALDMMSSKLPNVLKNLTTPVHRSPYLDRNRSEEVLNRSLIQEDLYGTVADPEMALSQLLAAAMSGRGLSSEADQLAQIASNLAVGYRKNNAPRRSSNGYLSEGDIVSPRRPRSSARQSPLRPLSDKCRWGIGQSVDAIYEPIDDEDDFGEQRAKSNFTLRAKENDYAPPKRLFSNSATRSLKPAQWSTGSITSDYESSKDLYDSSTVSSASQISAIYANGRRSSSPSVMSEAASESQTSDSGYPDSVRRRTPASVPFKERPTFTLHTEEGRGFQSEALAKTRPRHAPPRRPKKWTTPSLAKTPIARADTLESSGDASPESGGEADAQTPARQTAPDRRKRTEAPVHRRADNVTILSLP